MKHTDFKGILMKKVWILFCNIYDYFKEVIIYNGMKVGQVQYLLGHNTFRQR